MPCSVMKNGDDKDKDGKSDAIEVATLKINLIDKNDKLRG